MSTSPSASHFSEEDEEEDEESENYSSSSSSSSKTPRASVISKTPFFITPFSSNGYHETMTRLQTPSHSKEVAWAGSKCPPGVVEPLQVVKTPNGEPEMEKGSLIWEDHQFDYLVECLLEQACIPGMKVRGTIRPKGMRAVAAKMMEKFGPEFNIDKIRNKLKKAKRNLAICNDLLSHTGFQFDKDKKCLLVDYDLWDRHVKSYSEHKSFRNASRWKHYKELREIFGESIPSGVHGVTLAHEFAQTGVEKQATSADGVTHFIQATNEIENASDGLIDLEHGSLIWADHQFDYLVECLLEQARIPGTKDRCGGIKSKGWKAVEEKMMAKFGPKFNRAKIRNKLKKVKINLAICKYLLSQNGFNFDIQNKCLVVDDDMWKKHVQIYRKHKSFRNASHWKHYEELCEIFGDSIPIDKNGVLEPESVYAVVGDHATINDHAMDLDDDDILCNLPSNEAAPSRLCRKKMSKKRKTDALMAKGFSDLGDAIHTLVDSSSSGVMDKCSSILSDWLKEGVINEEIYMEMLDLFENERLPVLFIHCKPEMRLIWLKRRLIMQKGE